MRHSPRQSAILRRSLTGAIATFATYGCLTAAASSASADDTPVTVDSLPVVVTVQPEGALTVTETSLPIELVQSRGSQDAAYDASSTLVVVSETRNTYPGWSVSGQVSDIMGSGAAAQHRIPGTQLGWTPTGTAADGAVLGPPVAPAAPGVGSAGAVLASAAAGSGFGQSDLAFDLDLKIPQPTRAGDYSGTLTLTCLTAQP